MPAAIMTAPTKAAAHILLRVPDIALRAKVSSAQIGRDELCNDSFDNFGKAAQRRKRADRQPGRPGLRCAGGAVQEPSHGINQQKAEGEMDSAIVVIAFRAASPVTKTPLELFWRRCNGRRWYEWRERSESTRRINWKIGIYGKWEKSTAAVTKRADSPAANLCVRADGWRARSKKQRNRRVRPGKKNKGRSCAQG